jgi:hypothetical protein
MCIAMYSACGLKHGISLTTARLRAIVSMCCGHIRQHLAIRASDSAKPVYEIYIPKVLLVVACHCCSQYLHCCDRDALIATNCKQLCAMRLQCSLSAAGTSVALRATYALAALDIVAAAVSMQHSLITAVRSQIAAFAHAHASLTAATRYCALL